MTTKRKSDEEMAREYVEANLASAYLNTKQAEYIKADYLAGLAAGRAESEAELRSARLEIECARKWLADNPEEV